MVYSFPPRVSRKLSGGLLVLMPVCSIIREKSHGTAPGRYDDAYIHIIIYIRQDGRRFFAGD